MSVKKYIVHLCVPQLLQPLVLWNRDFLFEPQAPFLSSLLSQFELQKNSGIEGLDASLFQTLGLTKNLTKNPTKNLTKHLTKNRELPFATYRSRVHFNKKIKHTLLCADPVHLEVGMNDITLTDKIIDLSDEESHELIADLNKHFNQDGIAFIFGSNRHWYISLPEQEVISTTPLDQALRQNIAQLLPQSDARNWQMILNESQMILHASEINQQREIAGLTTANSLWFWGSGQAIKYNPDDAETAVSHIFYNDSDDSKLRAKTMAEVAKCDRQVLPSADELQKILLSQQGKSLLILDSLFLPAIHNDLDQYQQALSQLDDAIIKPLLALWKQERIELIIDGCDGKVFKAVKPSVLKFWKKKSIALTELAKR